MFKYYVYMHISVVSDAYSCSQSMSWKNRVVNAELNVSGVVGHLPGVQLALAGLCAQGLRFNCPSLQQPLPTFSSQVRTQDL